MKKTCIIFGIISLTMAALSQSVPLPIPKPAAEPVVEPAAQPDRDEAEKPVIGKGYTMNKEITLDIFLAEYGRLVNRTIIKAQNLPKVDFDFRVHDDLTYQESVALFDTLLATRGIAVIPLGEKFVQVIPAAEVTKTPPIPLLIRLPSPGPGKTVLQPLART